jgi:penicillin-binding protein 2
VFEGGGGTARRFKIKEFQAAGKTGTAENPHGKDHSLFMAFAPYDNPKIAIAVVVENSGFGSTWAAPIASLMMELYITGEIKRPEMEQFLLENFPDPVEQ